jgi:hypothetical protein
MSSNTLTLECFEHLRILYMRTSEKAPSKTSGEYVLHSLGGHASYRSSSLGFPLQGFVVPQVYTTPNHLHGALLPQLPRCATRSRLASAHKATPRGRPEPGRTFVHGANDGYLLSLSRGYRRGRRRREFWEAHSRRVALRLRCGEARLLRRTSRFTCKSAQNKEPTSGLEPLTCSLRVCGHWLLSVAGACKSRINRGFRVPSIARDCRVLRPG